MIALFVIWLLLAVVTAMVALLSVPLAEAWRTVFIAEGALALGVGAAILILRRLAEGRDLNDTAGDYEDLRNRSQILLRQAERLERQVNIERQLAAR